MQNPTREEMIRMAHETRRQVTNAEVPDELMQQFPVTIEEKTIPFEEGDIRVFYSYPDKMKNPDVLILNMHGGGFIRGRTPNDELFCRRMNHALSCRILDLDYKTAPDYPFPADSDVVRLDCDELAEQAENPKGQSLVMVGAMVRRLGLFDPEFAMTSMDRFFAEKGKSKFQEKNRRAFAAGFEAAK